VERILRDEVHADALRANEAHDLLDLLDERFRRIVEEQMRLVEEEHEARLLQISDLGQMLEELREQPQQEHAVDTRRMEKLVRGKNIHDAAVAVAPQEIVDVEHRLAEESIAALRLEREQSALNRADGSRGDVAVLHAQLGGVLAD